jgi:heparan-alpha-glucosaminide N-acetyltransferase
MYEAIKDNDDNDHQWREKKDIESALQISRSSSLPPDKERLVSLDVFRGLTVAVSFCSNHFLIRDQQCN